MTQTKTDPSIGSWLRPRMIGAAAALLLVMGACSSTSVETPATTTTASPMVTTAATTETTGPAAPTTTSTIPPEPSVVLAAALDQYASRYQFSGTATVNGAVATAVTGRWVDAASQMVIRSGDGEVEYVITTEGQWARLPDGIWEELDGTPPAGNPLAALATPDSLELVETAGTNVTLRAVYPAATLGLEGDPVEVQLVFDDGSLIEASYRIEVEGNIAESVTTFATPADTSPIVNPTG
ncbi:MAG: hypothetical protein U9N84_04420 [Actinomycetota bacterium]|nr:hypothetical protein [Actinomycetota bacterium]